MEIEVFLYRLSSENLLSLYKRQKALCKQLNELGVMGTGKVVRCKECGCELSVLEGVGFDNEPIQAEESLKCPQCGSVEFEDTNTQILWD